MNLTAAIQNKNGLHQKRYRPAAKCKSHHYSVFSAEKTAVKFSSIRTFSDNIFVAFLFAGNGLKPSPGAKLTLHYNSEAGHKTHHPENFDSAFNVNPNLYCKFTENDLIPFYII